MAAGAADPEAPRVAGGGGKRRAGLRWALRLLGPVLLVVVLARVGDAPRTWAAVKSASPAPLLLAFALNLLAIHLKALRWRITLGVRGISYPMRDAFVAFAASLALGLATPGRVGDVVRARYVQVEVGASPVDALASIVVDRLTDLWILSAAVSIALVRWSRLLPPETRLVAWAAVIASVSLPALLLLPGAASRAATALYRRVRGPLPEDGAARFIEAIRAQLGLPIVANVGLTSAALAVSVAQVWLVSRALGYGLSVVDVGCLLAVGNFLGLLPVSISGLGVREAFYALVFPGLGLTSDAGVTFGLASFVVAYLGLFAIGLVAWQVKPPPT